MMLLVARRDWREMRSTAAFRIMMALVALVTVVASAGISIALRLQSWYGDAEARPALDLIVGLVAYFLPLFVLTSFIWSFASLPVVKEKANGNIECLLATPLGPRALWAGKGLAVFVPGYVTAAIATAIVLLAVNLAAIRPGWETFALPGPALANGLVINPLLFCAVLLFTILYSMAGNPDAAMAPSFIVGFGLMIGVPVGLATGAVDICSWPFALWCLAGAAAAWGVLLLLSRRLTRQDIVLSGRGG